MIQKFLYLEWKAFFRSASFSTNLALKILMGFIAIYFILVFLALELGLLYSRKMNLDPIVTVNKFMIYYILDLISRLMLQKNPSNEHSMLVFPIKKSTIVHFSLGKLFCLSSIWFMVFYSLLVSF
jgi:hypothetical protein